MLGAAGRSDSTSTATTSKAFKRIQSAYLDEKKGVWKCRNCDWTYPQPNPSAQQRRDHKKRCADAVKVRHWLGIFRDRSTEEEEGSEGSRNDSNATDGLEILNAAAKQRLAQLKGADDGARQSRGSALHYAAEGQSKNRAREQGRESDGSRAHELGRGKGNDKARKQHGWSGDRGWSVGSPVHYDAESQEDSVSRAWTQRDIAADDASSPNISIADDVQDLSETQLTAAKQGIANPRESHDGEIYSMASTYDDDVESQVEILNKAPQLPLEEGHRHVRQSKVYSRKYDEGQDEIVNNEKEQRSKASTSNFNGRRQGKLRNTKSIGVPDVEGDHYFRGHTYHLDGEDEIELLNRAREQQVTSELGNIPRDVHDLVRLSEGSGGHYETEDQGFPSPDVGVDQEPGEHASKLLGKADIVEAVELGGPSLQVDTLGERFGTSEAAEDAQSKLTNDAFKDGVLVGVAGDRPQEPNVAVEDLDQSKKVWVAENLDKSNQNVDPSEVAGDNALRENADVVEQVKERELSSKGEEDVSKWTADLMQEGQLTGPKLNTEDDAQLKRKSKVLGEFDKNKRGVQEEDDTLKERVEAEKSKWRIKGDDDSLWGKENVLEEPTASLAGNDVNDENLVTGRGPKVYGSGEDQEHQICSKEEVSQNASPQVQSDYLKQAYPEAGSTIGQELERTDAVLESEAVLEHQTRSKASFSTGVDVEGNRSVKEEELVDTLRSPSVDYTKGKLEDSNPDSQPQGITTSGALGMPDISRGNQQTSLGVEAESGKVVHGSDQEEGNYQVHGSSITVQHETGETSRPLVILSSAEANWEDWDDVVKGLNMLHEVRTSPLLQHHDIIESPFLGNSTESIGASGFPELVRASSPHQVEPVQVAEASEPDSGIDTGGLTVDSLIDNNGSCAGDASDQKVLAPCLDQPPEMILSSVLMPTVPPNLDMDASHRQSFEDKGVADGSEQAEEKDGLQVSSLTSQPETAKIPGQLWQLSSAKANWEHWEDVVKCEYMLRPSPSLQQTKDSKPTSENKSCTSRSAVHEISNSNSGNSGEAESVGEVLDPKSVVEHLIGVDDRHLPFLSLESHIADDHLKTTGDLQDGDLEGPSQYNPPVQIAEVLEPDSEFDTGEFTVDSLIDDHSTHPQDAKAQEVRGPCPDQQPEMRVSSVLIPTVAPNLDFDAPPRNSCEEVGSPEGSEQMNVVGGLRTSSLTSQPETHLVNRQLWQVSSAEANWEDWEDVVKCKYMVSEHRPSPSHPIAKDTESSVENSNDTESSSENQSSASLALLCAPEASNASNSGCGHSGESESAGEILDPKSVVEHSIGIDDPGLTFLSLESGIADDHLRTTGDIQDRVLEVPSQYNPPEATVTSVIMPTVPSQTSSQVEVPVIKSLEELKLEGGTDAGEENLLPNLSAISQAVTGQASQWLPPLSAAEANWEDWDSIVKGEYVLGQPTLLQKDGDAELLVSQDVSATSQDEMGFPELANTNQKVGIETQGGAHGIDTPSDSGSSLVGGILDDYSIPVEGSKGTEFGDSNHAEKSEPGSSVCIPALPAQTKVDVQVPASLLLKELKAVARSGQHKGIHVVNTSQYSSPVGGILDDHSCPVEGLKESKLGYSNLTKVSETVRLPALPPQIKLDVQAPDPTLLKEFKAVIGSGQQEGIHVVGTSQHRAGLTNRQVPKDSSIDFNPKDDDKTSLEVDCPAPTRMLDDHTKDSKWKELDQSRPLETMGQLTTLDTAAPSPISEVQEHGGLVFKTLESLAQSPSASSEQEVDLSRSSQQMLYLADANWEGWDEVVAGGEHFLIEGRRLTSSKGLTDKRRHISGDDQLSLQLQEHAGGSGLEADGSEPHAVVEDETKLEAPGKTVILEGVDAKGKLLEGLTTPIREGHLRTSKDTQEKEIESAVQNELSTMLNASPHEPLEVDECRVQPLQFNIPGASPKEGRIVLETPPSTPLDGTEQTSSILPKLSPAETNWEDWDEVVLLRHNYTDERRTLTFVPIGHAISPSDSGAEQISPNLSDRYYRNAGAEGGDASRQRIVHSEIEEPTVQGKAPMSSVGQADKDPEESKVENHFNAESENLQALDLDSVGEEARDLVDDATPLVKTENLPWATRIQVWQEIDDPESDYIPIGGGESPTYRLTEDLKGRATFFKGMQGTKSSLTEITDYEDRTLDSHQDWEANARSSPEPAVYDTEGVLISQNLYKLLCPVCGACISTKVVVRKKKQRTFERDENGRLLDFSDEDDEALLTGSPADYAVEKPIRGLYGWLEYLLGA